MNHPREPDPEQAELGPPLLRLRPPAQKGVILTPMHALKAQVKNSRLVLDEPTDLPEGEVVGLTEAVSAT